MKKLLLFSLFLLIYSFIIPSCNQNTNYIPDSFSEIEKKYIIDNNLTIDDYQPYMKYKRFNILDFHNYEALKTNNHLEAINIYYNSNYYEYTPYQLTYPALYLNTSHVLVNKHYFLEKDYIPLDLVLLENYNVPYIHRENEHMQLNKIAIENYTYLYEDALKNNINLYIYSAYRDYSKQEYLYYVVNMSNDNYSARPGYSEHQTGLALDISTLYYGLTNDFSQSDAYLWLKDNSYKYGFILRYPKEKENITLYNFEPWHFRYVGKEIASYIYYNNLTLEEYIIKNYEL